MKNTVTPPLHGAAPAQSEAQLQSRCVVWFKNTHRELRSLYYQIKNDGKKHKASASLDTAMGVTAGIPDTHLAIARGGHHSLYIEFKTLTGKLGPEQKEVIAQLRAQGHRVEVVRSEAEFRALIADYLSLQ